MSVTSRRLLSVLCACAAVGAVLTPASAAPARASDAAVFIETQPPASTGPARGPANLAFVSATTGYAATTGGAHWIPRIGWRGARTVSAIQRTDDGGITWRNLWTGRKVYLQGIDANGSTVVVSGTRRRTPTDRSDPDDGPSLFLASADSGRTWSRTSAPPTAISPQILTPTTWVGVHVRDYGRGPTVLFRTDNAGKNWRRLRLPAHTGVVKFATPALGFVSAKAVTCTKRIRKAQHTGRYYHPPVEQVWRTRNGGGTWTPLPGTCSSTINDIDAQSPALIVVAGGSAEPHNSGFLRRTTDGGETWTRVLATADRSIDQVSFGDAEHGAIVEVSHTGNSGASYIAWSNLRFTADGGRTWSTRGLPATDARATLFEGRYVWVGNQSAGAIWRTNSADTAWRVAATPQLVDPWAPGLSGPGVLSIESAAGPLSSSDNGRTWAPALRPNNRTQAIAEGRNAFLTLNSRGTGYRGWVTTSTGIKAITIPNLGPDGQIAFTDPLHGLISGYDAALYSTVDGGKTWQTLPTPHGMPDLDWAGAGPGVVAAASTTQIALSVDNGRHWSRVAGTNDFPDCNISRVGRAIWVTCGSYGPTVLVTSFDGGLTWQRRTVKNDLDVVGVGGREAWGTAPETGSLTTSPTRLWHTVDGGTTWTEEWIQLNPYAAVPQIDCASGASGPSGWSYARCIYPSSDSVWRRNPKP